MEACTHSGLTILLFALGSVSPPGSSWLKRSKKHSKKFCGQQEEELTMHQGDPQVSMFANLILTRNEE